MTTTQHQREQMIAAFDAGDDVRALSSLPNDKVDRAGATEPANHNNPSSPAPVERLDGRTSESGEKP